MASSNIKLFDENKGNMLSDSEFNISNQRMNGLQTGVASSQLQNKAMYQASLIAYAIAQIMMQNGKNANDTDAVSAFVANLSGTMLQKVYDIATTAEAQAGVATGKWMSPALVKSAIDSLAAKAQNILSDETKALFGLGTDAVPDDAFAALFGVERGGNLALEKITESMTWVAPKSIGQKFRVIAVGGGGGGGGSADSIGGGGGGGGYVEIRELVIPQGTSVDVVCGAGGAGGSNNSSVGENGADGGTTQFGSYFSAAGGKGGKGGEKSGYYGGVGGDGGAGGGGGYGGGGNGGNGGTYGGGGGGSGGYGGGNGGNGGTYGGGGGCTSGRTSGKGGTYGGNGGVELDGENGAPPSFTIIDAAIFGNLEYASLGGTSNGRDCGGGGGGYGGCGGNAGNGGTSEGGSGGGGGYGGNGGNGSSKGGGGGGSYGGNGGNGGDRGGGGGAGLFCNGGYGGSYGGGAGGGIISGGGQREAGGSGGCYIIYYKEA